MSQQLLFFHLEQVFRPVDIFTADPSGTFGSGIKQNIAGDV